MFGLCVCVCVFNGTRVRLERSEKEKAINECSEVDGSIIHKINGVYSGLLWFYDYNCKGIIARGPPLPRGPVLLRG